MCQRRKTSCMQLVSADFIVKIENICEKMDRKNNLRPLTKNNIEKNVKERVVFKNYNFSIPQNVYIR